MRAAESAIPGFGADRIGGALRAAAATGLAAAALLAGPDAAFATSDTTFGDANGVYREASYIRVVLEPAGWRPK